MEAQLSEYARLVIRTGVNLREGQPLVINAPIECADFARRLAREGYAAGAKDVVVVWNDERLSRIRFEMASEDALSRYQNDPYHCSVVKAHMHAVRASSVAVDYYI